MPAYTRAARVCQGCKRSYIPASNRQSFCSDCPRCERCGARKPRTANRWCSQECRRQSISLPLKPCANCGGPVPRERSRKAVYCSVDCRHHAERNRNIGHRFVGVDGYVTIKVLHAQALNGDQWLPEHRVVMAHALGRELRSHEHVHHKNGDKTDNRLTNLELWLVGCHPSGQSVRDLVAYARGILAEYGDVDAYV